MPRVKVYNSALLVLRLHLFCPVSTVRQEFHGWAAVYIV
jgi:hypothetical protein